MVVAEKMKHRVHTEKRKLALKTVTVLDRLRMCAVERYYDIAERYSAGLGVDVVGCRDTVLKQRERKQVRIFRRVRSW